ncbi:hypothetical protein [Actinokineospora iranica]|uniref:Uncharacterized protein n=1 Tax=Actinokineospora iranica TaxID=1271860 RepID=A0A1G6MF89_9PSEU|nr:hypothetical protein [Actinokineospora iranica]SDC53656.1 hypothetical protein SAMN05216174_102502 [Actinokineospora iranica]
MERQDLRAGAYVRWAPPDGTTGVDLVEGAPGIITGPHWQDVEVKWFLREDDPVSQHVYNYQWLREVGPLEFLDACVAVRDHERR